MREIDRDELISLRRELPNLVTLDCRGPDYWRWERIPGSNNLRWKYIEERAETLFPDKATPIVTYCDGITCPASAKANMKLSDLGYSDLFEYSGGLSDWRASGLETDCDREHKLAENFYLFPNQSRLGEPHHSFLIQESDRIVLIDGPEQLTEETEDFILNFGRPVELLFRGPGHEARVDELTHRLKATACTRELSKASEVALRGILQNLAKKKK